MRDERIEWPPPRPDPDREPSHPWAGEDGLRFDWDSERARQRRAGELYVETDKEREDRERNILPERGPRGSD